MPMLGKKSGRPVRPSKADLFEKLKTEACTGREALKDVGMLEQRQTSVSLEPWKIPVPLLDQDPDLAENSARCADALVRFEASNNDHSNFETGSGAASHLITVTMINGEEMELLVQPCETVRDLAKRIALMKGVGQVKLLANHAPLPEGLLARDCLPHSSVVTAILQFGFDVPNGLEPIVKQQIRHSCERHGAREDPDRSWAQLSCESPEAKEDPEAFWDAAFKKPNWKEFAQHIGTQDFRIRVFSFGLSPLNQTRFIYCNFGIRMTAEFSRRMSGDPQAEYIYRYGFIHAENEVYCTAEVLAAIQGHCNTEIHGHFQATGEYQILFPDRETTRFLKGLHSAAFAQYGIEKYGAW